MHTCISMAISISHFLFVMGQELEENLKKSAEEFKEFERQDLKYREDIKHKKQKLKKLEEKMEKVNITLLANLTFALFDICFL